MDEDFPPLPSNPPTPSLSLNPLAQPFIPPNPLPSLLITPNLPSQNTSWSRKLFSLLHIPEIQRLEFFPPVFKNERLVALCSKTEVDSTAGSWKNAIQGFFAGKRPFLGSIFKAVEKAWKLQGTVEIFSRPDDSVIFIFSSPEDRMRVLELGPWFLLGQYLHIRTWSREVRSRKEFFGFMPIWLRLPNLPLQFWSPGSIGRITSVVGKPLYLDDKSANASRLRFARVCVEVSARMPLPETVLIEVEGEDGCSHEQRIEYETSIKLCTKCESFGHGEEACEEANRCKSTLTVNRKPKMVDPPIRSKSGVSDSRAVGREIDTGDYPSSRAVEGLIQKDIIAPITSEPEWKLVTKKKKQRKKRVNRMGKSGDLSEKGSRNQPPVFHRPVDRGKPGSLILPENRGVPSFLPESQGGFSNFKSPEGQKSPKTQSAATPLVSGFSGLERVPNESQSSKDQGTKPPWPPDPDVDAAQRFSWKGPFKNPVDTAVSDAIEGTDAFGTLGPVDVVIEPVDTTLSSPGSSPILGDLLVNTPISKGSNQDRVRTVEATGLLEEPDVSNQDLVLFSSSKINCNPTHILPNPSRVSVGMGPGSLHLLEADYTDDSDEDTDVSFPPGFTPSKEEMIAIRDLLKEGASMMPPEHREEFVRSVEFAKDDEIMDFFHEKLEGGNEKSVKAKDTNFLMTHGVRRSPRIKKKP